jgi:lipopolysaccharide heptosyltransferase II
MGDVLMSTPAYKALTNTIGCEITLLTSHAGRGIAQFIPDIDEVITYDVPWVKGGESSDDSFFKMVNLLKEKKFDGAIIFTVFSQNPLPSAMLAYLANIPLRLAYCRENPYNLLTHWVPEEEPYTFIRHQVQRDLDLVKTIGASIHDTRLTLMVTDKTWPSIIFKLENIGVDIQKPWIIFHPGVSEFKRQYPKTLWIETGRKIAGILGCPILITGSSDEQNLCKEIADGIGENAFSVAGIFSLEEFIVVQKRASLIISVNTGTIHIAAALRKPVIVLYALTNPQHAPWKTTGKILPFPVQESLQSRNEVLKHLRHTYFKGEVPMVAPEEIIQAVKAILIDNVVEELPELIVSNNPVLA